MVLRSGLAPSVKHARERVSDTARGEAYAHASEGSIIDGIPGLQPATLLVLVLLPMLSPAHAHSACAACATSTRDPGPDTAAAEEQAGEQL
jgi:hypothetical protein